MEGKVDDSLGEKIGKLIKEVYIASTGKESLIDIRNMIFESLVFSGYVVRFNLREERAEKLGLRTPILDIKTGNNGGFGFHADPEGAVHVSLAISVNGRKVNLFIALSDIESIVALMEENVGIPFDSIVLGTVSTTLQSDYLVEEREVEMTEPKDKPKSNVVNLFDRKKN